MRTTLTLDADVARGLKARVARGKVSFKEAVNDALRRGLGIGPQRAAREPFVVRAHAGGLAPGVDPRRLNQLAAELEDAATLRKPARA